MSTKDEMRRSMAVGEDMMDRFWDMWLITLGTFSWTQEQVENMAKTYLDQQKTTREESIKLIEEMMNQVRKNQSQLQKMIDQAVLEAFEGVRVPYVNNVDELSRKVGELSKKVDEL